MSDERDDKKPGSPAPEPSEGIGAKHHGRSRRAFVKRAAIGGVVLAGVSSALPKKWAKPVIDSVIVPLHAQSTGGTIAVRWIIGDDAPGGSHSDAGGIMAGTTNVGDFLYDDGTDMSFHAVLSPPAAVAVSISVNQSGTSYGGDDFGTLIADASADSGEADFGTFSPPNSDFGDSPGSGSIQVTFSAPGYADSVITLNVGV